MSMNVTNRRALSLEELNDVHGEFFLTGLAIIGISTGIGLIAAHPDCDFQAE